MHRIEGFCLGFGQLLALLSDNAQTSGFEPGIDLAGQVAACCIGFDN